MDNKYAHFHLMRTASSGLSLISEAKRGKATLYNRMAIDTEII